MEKTTIGNKEVADIGSNYNVNLGGASKTRQRVENDFYATPFKTTEAILNKEVLLGSILEPACGEGHIVKVLKEYYPFSEIVATDLIKRKDIFNLGLGGETDFLTYDFGRKFDNVITNPPFTLAKEFIEKALEIANDKVLIFGRIQLLETTSRRKLFETTPLKYVYVFSERQTPLPNGKELDENGKAWSSAMCFAWFVWEKGYKGDPIIKWL